MAPYVPVLPPFAHQIEAGRLMARERAFALLMSRRTGKTKVIIDDWASKVHAGELRNLLYTAPAGALYGEDALETQALQHLPAEMRERAIVATWRSGPTVALKNRLGMLLANRDKRRPRVLLVNIEALSVDTGAMDLCREFLSQERALNMMTVGESTSIKGDGRRTERAEELGLLAAWRRIETGLVAPHSPMDLFHQFNFLDWHILGCRSFMGYRARYAILKKVSFVPAHLRTGGERKSTVIVGYRNEDELREKIAPYSYRKQLKDCYDVPQKVYQFQDVGLTDVQARMYRDLVKFSTAELDAASHVTVNMAMTKVLRLHQLLCGHMVDDDDKLVRSVPEKRTAAILDILQEYDGKAIVWVAYRHSIEDIVARLRKEYGPDSTAAFWGGNAKTREEEERRFKGDPRCRFMVSSAKAGGKGREWKVANLSIYHSNNFNLEDREQSEDRDQAIGKFDPVTCIDLRAVQPDGKATVDFRFIKNLREKIDMASTLQGDGYKQWLI